MTKCTPCRVRHLTCDQNIVCSECSKSNRECLRGYNLRFRYLTCPSIKPSRADFGKYEFFFDGEQTWVKSNRDNGKIEFVLEGDEEVSEVGTEEVDIIDEDRVSGSNVGHDASRNPSAQEVDASSHLASLEPLGSSVWSKLDILAEQSLAEAASSGIGLSGRSRFMELQTPPVPRDASVWPVTNLRECRLLQHFIVHLAPWVSLIHEIFDLSPLTITSSTSATRSGISADTYPAWCCPVLSSWQLSLPSPLSTTVGSSGTAIYMRPYTTMTNV